MNLPKPIEQYNPEELIAALNEQYEAADTLNIFQHAIQALALLHAQVKTGGYVQLAQNKFGEYIFENAWPEAFDRFGAGKLADNLREAAAIYLKNKEELERENSLEDFVALYDRFPELDALHQQYMSIAADELQAVKKFIEDKPGYFEMPS